MSYQRLSPDDPHKFDYEDISKNLRSFDKKIKDFQKTGGSSQSSLIKEIKIIQDHLTEIFRRPRITKDDKTRLLSLENQYRELNSRFQDLKPQEMESSRDFRDGEDLEELGIQERNTLAYHDSGQLKQAELLERKENIEILQKDFVIVNSLFKDTAMMVGEQGKMLEETLMVDSAREVPHFVFFLLIFLQKRENLLKSSLH